MKSLLAASALLLVTTACGPKEPSSADAREAPKAASAAAVAWDQFGGQVSDTEPVALADLLARAEELADQTIVVEGEVDGVCKKKGCWMTMHAGGESMRVTFQDYGFFVPLDCEGRKVRMEGVFTQEVTPVDDLKHYLEDAGKHEEAAKVTEPKVEYKFVATGVRMAPVAMTTSKP